MNSINVVVRAKSTWVGLVNGVEDGKRKPTSWFPRWIKMGCALAGSALFFGSFGLLTMPFLAGWSWLGTGIAFIGAQYASQVLLDLPEYWEKASAYLLIAKLAAKKNVKDGLNALIEEISVARAGGEPQEA